jgi:EAL domain-containing protein (putative c-di-GMP-specific phosphodiesterase class I)
MDKTEPGAAERNASRLRAAALCGELSCVYQPIVRLAGGGVAGAEALVRWEHPALGPLSPDAFVGDAEASGVVSTIGAFVLDVACRDATRWPDGPDGPLELWVNVSPMQLVAGDLVKDVDQALGSSGLDPSRLVLELTETPTELDLDSASREFACLREQGIRVALDDVGSGYSSLLRLVRLPVEMVKIERELVAGVFDGRHAVAVVRALVALAGALQMRAVAEGVETAEQVDRLLELGCDYGQGFYFGRPQDADTFVAMLRSPR